MSIVGDLDVAGPDCDAAYHAIKRMRWAKCANWLRAPQTALSLPLAGLLMRPALQFMGKSFADARYGAISSIVPFTSAIASPAEATVRRLQNLLSNMDDRFWMPTVAQRGWTQEILHLVAVIAYAFMGGLCLRYVFGFREPPWVLATLTLPETTAARKQEIEAQILQMSS